jgi:hypothetical protein
MMCTWHALAKLRLHTDYTLDALKTATKQLGQQLRYFQAEVCPAFKTYETANELEARARRALKKIAREQNAVTSTKPTAEVDSSPLQSENAAPATVAEHPSPSTFPSPRCDSAKPDNFSQKLPMTSSHSPNPTLMSTTHHVAGRIQKRQRDDGTLVLVVPPNKRFCTGHTANSPAASIAGTTVVSTRPKHSVREHRPRVIVKKPSATANQSKSTVVCDIEPDISSQSELVDPVPTLPTLDEIVRNLPVTPSGMLKD